MKNKSIWTVGLNKKATNKLDKNINCDILIIGGGIAGISTAYFLKDSNKDIVLIDKDVCGYGITANTTAKLTYLQGAIYYKLEKNFNNKFAIDYLNSQKEAINIVKDIVNSNSIDCNLTKTDSYLFSTDTNCINKEKKFFDNNNIKYETVNTIPINFDCNLAIKIDDSYVFHPIKYINAIKDIIITSGIKVYEKTFATTLEKKDNHYEVTTKEHKIIAKKVIVCTHYPFFVNPFFLPFKSCIEKSYILVAKTNDNLKLQAITDKTPIHSIRYYTNDYNYIIYSGNSHKTASHVDVSNRFDELSLEFKKHINKNIDYYYSNHDIMTPDNIAYIGRINKEDDSLLIATGFNKWGMTNGTIAGRILANIILNKKDEYEYLFDPNRSITKDTVINLVLFNVITGSRLVLTKIKKNYDFYENKVKITNLDGKKVGIYIDDKGKKHVVLNTCPHMKCSLIFNKKEKTWDCPCHASRFDIDGNVIFGPSVYNIKLKK